MSDVRSALKVRCRQRIGRSRISTRTLRSRHRRDVTLIMTAMARADTSSVREHIRRSVGGDSDRGVTPVDGNGGPRDVRGFVGAKEGDHTGDLGGLPGARNRSFDSSSFGES